MIAPYLDAANIDLKAANDAFYRRVCGARWEPVRDTIVEMRRRGIWIELTTLLIPGLNDDRHELTAMAEWIATAVGPETPWHLTRFQPAHRMSNATPTPARTMVEAAEIAREVGLRHVYVGNAHVRQMRRAPDCPPRLRGYGVAPGRRPVPALQACPCRCRPGGFPGRRLEGCRPSRSAAAVSAAASTL
jgi:pyruvate formate lyase activating enzyme